MARFLAIVSRQVLTFSTLTAVTLGLLLCSEPAHAIDSQYPAAGTCEYPTEVQVFAVPSSDHPNPALAGVPSVACSAVYLGHDTVLTAGHCVDSMDSVEFRFGEHRDNPQWSGQGDCTVYPSGEWTEKSGPLGPVWLFTGVDLAVCALDGGNPEPDHLPILVPGSCENDYVRHELFGPGADPFGAPITFVGNGLESADTSGPLGTKRYAPGQLLFEAYNATHNTTVVQSLQPGQEQGSNGASVAVRPGDSGGPLVLPMQDGSARVVGVMSHLSQANYDLDGTGQTIRLHVLAAPAPRYLSWIENHSGAADLVDCFTHQGSGWDWDGDPGCKASFDITPESSTSTWSGNCVSSGVALTGECAGWQAPGPQNESAGPSEADMLLEFVLTGDGSAVTREFGRLSDLTPYEGTRKSDGLFPPSGRNYEVIVGVGDDKVFMPPGSHEVHGGSGDDLLFGSRKSEVFVPGYGNDYVEAGGGDDVIIVAGDCELEYGETLDGGSGYDILYSPLSKKKLAQLGVSLISIEEIVLNAPNASKAICNADGPSPLAMESKQ